MIERLVSASPVGFWGLLLFAPAMQPVSADDRQPPNIVLIMADDLGWKDLGCYGNPIVDTPHLDRLAEQGLLFTDAYSAAPVCTPTRAALLTGESPARLNITNHAPGHPPHFSKEDTDFVTPEWQRYLPLPRVTLAEQLRSAGYATAFVGKWHLSHVGKGAGLHEPDFRAEHQGFDINIGGCSFGGPPSYFAPFKLPNLQAQREAEYLPDRCAAECINFIESHQQNPFFLCWWNYSVHYPFQAPEELIAKYENLPAKNRPANPVYAAMIEGMDRAIGGVLQSLDRLGLERDTLVIFTSDNGPFAADVKPLRGEKGYLYEGGIRVPLIISRPGQIARGSRTSVPAITMDLHATLLEQAGLVPDESNVADGLSLAPLWGDSTAEQLTWEREALFFHYPNYAFHKKNRPGGAVRRGNMKLIHRYDDDSLELYDLEQDVGEQSNLANDRPALAVELKMMLDSWRQRTGAEL